MNRLYLLTFINRHKPICYANLCVFEVDCKLLGDHSALLLLVEGQQEVEMSRKELLSASLRDLSYRNEQSEWQKLKF